MKRGNALIGILFFGLVPGPMATGRLGADGLSVTPAKILIENLVPGRTYDLTEMADLPFTVKNTSGRKMRFFLSVQRPGPGTAEKGFEPVPDEKWIGLTPPEWELENGGEGKSRMVIRIPAGKKHLGKKYEAGILTAGSDPSGKRKALDFEIELLSRICFTVSPVEASEAEEKAGIDMNFNFMPQNLYLSNFSSLNADGVKTGENILWIENLNSTERNYFLKRIRPSEALVPLPAGYEEAPDDCSVRFSATNICLGALGKTGVRAEFSFPDKELYKGKRYLFVLSARSEGKESRGTRLVKVYARPFR